MSWFAAILLPQFPLQAALRLREELWTEPVAITDGSTEKGRVLERTDAAAASGVLRGMVSTQAMARCPALRLWTRSPAQEEAVSALLLETADTLSPLIEATGEGLCLVDLRQRKPCDWEAWARDALDRFAALQLRACIGVASNPDLATLAAKRAEPVLVVQHPGAFLAGIAVAEIDAPPELVGVLRDWGIGHLGELACLPRSEVIDRLGPVAGELWERATGRARRELRLVRPAEIFAEAFDFERPIETTEPLLFILRRQLDQLMLRLREALRVAGKMTLTIPLDSGAAYERFFTIPSPTSDAEVLMRILHTHLENLRLEQQPVGVRLLLEPVVAESRQHQLFESPLRDPNRFGETLGRLAALVGAENVGAVQMEDTHRPDRFRLVVPEFEKLAEATASEPRENRALGLPLRRFRPAPAAQVQLHRYIPTWLASSRAHGEIIDAAGPYRTSGDWWDGGAWSVEEWDIALGNGGLYRLSRHGDAWFVEGCYQLPRGKLPA
jgi:protein ImuB